MREVMEFWTGDKITRLEPNEIFVFGSNPEGRHGAGAAKSALKFGAQQGFGRGLWGSSYSLVTKNLTENFKERQTGIVYHAAGYRSVSKEQIIDNIQELYRLANQMLHNRFLISYQYETWPNKSPKKSLNVYTSLEMFEMFLTIEKVPNNIIFHNSYKSLIERHE